VAADIIEASPQDEGARPIQRRKRPLDIVAALDSNEISWNDVTQEQILLNILITLQGIARQNEVIIQNLRRSRRRV